MGSFLLPAVVIPSAITSVSTNGRRDHLNFSRRSLIALQINTYSFSLSPPLILLYRHRRRCRSVSNPKAVSSHSSSHAHGFCACQILKQATDSTFGRILDKLRSWGNLLPGGSWWQLKGEDEGEEVEGRWRGGVTFLQGLKRMWFLISRDRWVICLALASLSIASLAEVAVPHFLTASIFSAQSGQSAIFSKNIKIVVSLCLISGIFSGVRSCCFGIANMILVRRMRETLYSTLIFQDIAFFDAETIGDLTSRLGSDCQQVSRVIGNDFNLIFRNLLQGTGTLIFLFMISWPLALSMLLICAGLAVVMLFYGRFQKMLAKLMQDFTAGANEVSQETLSLIRTVRIYGTEGKEIERYMIWLERLWDLSLRQSVGYGFWSLSYNFFYHITQIVAVLVGGISIICGHMTPEQLTKFVLYAEWLIYSAWWVGDNWSSLMQSMGASEKPRVMLSQGANLHGKPSLEQLLPHGAGVLMGSWRKRQWGEYCPPRVLNALLHHLLLSVGQAVGRSGSGKSTITNLLLGLYEPSNGEILVDGIPLGDLDIRWFRERIGFVGQEPPIFRMDVSSNIRYGCTKETTQEEVEQAAEQALAHEFIRSLPNGYSTLVDSALLSGGQKQRIAIARAILRDPTILILDEATSALDAETEHYVKELLLSAGNASMEKKTVIVIAHRLSTIQAADQIAVMDKGRVVEVGNHNELMQKNGLYASLIQRQSGAFV
ncbi:hypothetical protein HPP92_002647 [Vanilla planifolia]|uniref:ABC transporter B family member 26, chloroplastic n=1 Tax=Vanilla planifolia TaxID=51239 RepID=A0A835S0P5_VANPL|nr:hypothetical protein HPP92_002647 [Vanilla planifolia]